MKGEEKSVSGRRDGEVGRDRAALGSWPSLRPAISSTLVERPLLSVCRGKRRVCLLWGKIGVFVSGGR